MAEPAAALAAAPVAMPASSTERIKLPLGLLYRLATSERALWRNASLHPSDSFPMACNACGVHMHEYSTLDCRHCVVCCRACVESEWGRAHACLAALNAIVEKRVAEDLRPSACWVGNDSDGDEKDERFARAEADYAARGHTCRTHALLETSSIYVAGDMAEKLREASGGECACGGVSERAERDERDDWRTCVECYKRRSKKQVEYVRALYSMGELSVGE